nr:MAG: RNA-dependent RNA polymerase [Riboviria sp.]
MSKQFEIALYRNRDLDVQPLHKLLTECFSLGDRLGEDAERARERAFNVTTSGALFKWHYLQSQVGKRFQEGTVTAKERESQAIQKFLEYEAVCRETNGRVYDAFNKPTRHREVLLRAKKIMHDLLGEFPLDRLPDLCSFSSGASTEFRRDRSAPQHKWDRASHVTKDAMTYAVAFQKWCGRNWPLTEVDGNKVFTVVKNYRSDRTCAKEPSWNMFFQKGVGGLIRQRLQRKVGLLLPDAQETHGRLAQEASIHGLNATLDLQGASDCVTLALVELLCPASWTKVFVDLRSHSGTLPNGSQISFEKISSMGNGYTFELETALFFCLVAAICGKEKVSVYGDDIICPSSDAQKVERLLAYCGFALNREKSFSSGPFRESCGGHYWNGRNVKPFYIERLPTTLGQIINLHNDIVAWLEDGPVYHRFILLLRACRRLVPRKYWGPAGTAGVLWAEWDEARPTFVRGCNRPLDKRVDGSRQVAYHHWRVRSIRRSVVVQKHDYYMGGYLYTLHTLHRKMLGHEQVKPRTRISLQDAATEGRRHESDVLLSELQFAQTRETEGWVAVDVKHRWPRLPIAI